MTDLSHVQNLIVWNGHYLKQMWDGNIYHINDNESERDKEYRERIDLSMKIIAKG